MSLMHESSVNLSSLKKEDKKNSDTDSQNNKSKQNFFSETIKFIVIAALIVLPIRIFVAQPFIVSGDSMVPTFHGGEYLIVDEISYRFENPDRGDVVIFRFPLDTSKFFIKRIIGLPGETVQIVRGQVFIINKDNPDGLKLPENYLENKSVENFEKKLGEDEYFVMGDNRPNSSDSRLWGPLPRDLIAGRALVRLLPLSKFGVFPGFSS